MVRRIARLTPAGRRILVQRVLEGRPLAHVAKKMGVSLTCAHRWFKRYVEHGLAGMARDGCGQTRRGPRGAG